MRPTTATVRIAAIVHNYELACRLAPVSKNIAVIKANAYGHGMLEVARILQTRVPAFAVALVEEAAQLRDAGIAKPILVLQGANDAADIKEAAERDLWLLLHRQQQVDALLSSYPTKPVRVWLKLETGMHRFGLVPDELDQVCADLRSSPGVQQSLVLCTHLACADNLTNPITRQQVSVIRSCSAKHGLGLSIANSAGILHWPETHADWNRPGYMLYGNCPTGAFGRGSTQLRPVMTMSSEIVAIRIVRQGESVGYGQHWVAEKPSKIGTIAIGYGDGYPRHAPNGTPVLVNGQRVPLAGRVSMDAICVDLTEMEKVEVGDPVELWGENLYVNEVASAAGTIGYEILAGLTGRVPLLYEASPVEFE
ncbi:MAG: alanine racemase [Gammaproteobacteria bacterium]|nr:alanine racemase [Gammaproteobacteria bacterium]